MSSCFKRFRGLVSLMVLVALSPAAGHAAGTANSDRKYPFDFDSTDYGALDDQKYTLAEQLRILDGRNERIFYFAKVGIATAIENLRTFGGRDGTNDPNAIPALAALLQTQAALSNMRVGYANCRGGELAGAEGANFGNMLTMFGGQAYAVGVVKVCASAIWYNSLADAAETYIHEAAHSIQNSGNAPWLSAFNFDRECHATAIEVVAAAYGWGKPRGNGYLTPSYSGRSASMASYIRTHDCSYLNRNGFMDFYNDVASRWH